jgi:hypothetical protein
MEPYKPLDQVPTGTIVPVADELTVVEKGVLDMAVHYYGGCCTALIPETGIEIGLPMAWATALEILIIVPQPGYV